jgi:cobyrinic acid a,c-diamide synthase
MTSTPRVVIAGTHSGSGKTTVASGVMAALTARGLRVQPFKVGPDFIDPSHHTLICGRISRNLDPFMMGEEGCSDTFLRASAGSDVAVIEGVMGMFDGIDGTDVSSTAHVARILKSPVILVVDAKGMSGSVHALIKGFFGYDPSVVPSGVIFNRVGSPRHRQMIERSLNVPGIGWVPRRGELEIQSRHLGLHMAGESDSLFSAGPVIEESTDIDGLLALARSAPSMPSSPQVITRIPKKAKIGIARDEAFCFYYQDNLDHLVEAGAELVFFSPIRDPLPDVDGVYLGGGYPELHLPALESSRCTADLRNAAAHGLPVYAECGGLMYISREIQAEKTYRMAGILPADAEMTARIQALGYVRGKVTGTCPLLASNLQIAGHEFHYSRILPDRDSGYAFTLSRGKGIESGRDGLVAGNALGSYTHSYFSRETAASFVASAERFSRQ